MCDGPRGRGTSGSPVARESWKCLAGALKGALKGATDCGPTDTLDNQIDTWLDPTVSDPHQLGELLKAPPEDFVSRQINSVKFDEAEYAKEIALDYTALLQNESSNQE